ncbi:hypothetical protein [Nocardioides sp.]|uniref:hypothetical protein n=1 Tax=Nocardioides sp. TaxID=35761 RepID=UPI0019B325AE|nr:hypothetical protein [Nocardioides sp.]MBC7279200.1 hypothetical protein [Nocardioides sp.]
MRMNVREYVRRDKDGNDVKVSKHSKNHKGSKPKTKRKTLAGRGWGNVVAAWRAGRKKKKWTAAALGVLGVVELGAYFMLQTTSFALLTLVVVAGLVALVANVAAGGRGLKR